MKTIITGSRSIKDYSLVKRTIEESGFQITEVVSGTAKGVDRLGERWAKENRVKLTQFEADWHNIYHPAAIVRVNGFGGKYDASAGRRRNKKMVDYADALIVIIENNSKRSMNILQIAQRRKLKIHCEFI
ncbi:MAG: DUF2493 domain-containing protein [Candidatus Hodarchaeota archaeon]